MIGAEVIEGDALAELREMESESVQCCITSPPYFGLRDYGNQSQVGLESTPDEYVAKLVEVFGEVKRVLRDDGTLWLNLGDSYAGSWGAQSRSAVDGGTSTLTGSPLSGRQIAEHPKGSKTGTIPAGASFKAKDLLGIPWLTALALRAGGWYLRRDIIWSKPNPMPESVTDRPTSAHEYVFLLSKSAQYYYDAEAIKDGYAPGTAERYEAGGFSDRYADAADAKGYRGPFGGKDGHKVGTGANKRSVWTVATQPYPETHFATFPPKLIEPMALAGCPRDGTILDPFAGSGTTLQVAVANGRSAIGIELNPDYCALARRRLAGVTPSMFDAHA